MISSIVLFFSREAWGAGPAVDDANVCAGCPLVVVEVPEAAGAGGAAGALPPKRLWPPVAPEAPFAGGAGLLNRLDAPVVAGAIALGAEVVADEAGG